MSETFVETTAIAESGRAKRDRLPKPRIRIARLQAGDVRPGDQTGVRSQERDESANQDGTTGFVNDGVTTANKIVKPLDIDSVIIEAGNTQYQQGIKEFLSKPIQFQQFSYTSSSLPADVLMYQNLDAGTLFAKFPLWGNKISGFNGIRGTIRARLQINGNPFQQGRLIMSYIPMQQHYNYQWNRMGSLTTVTQLPHVQIDVACDSEATLEIPYVTLQSHHNVLNGEGAWGILYVSSYMPFATGSTGSTDVQCVLWLSLHDVELVTPSIPLVMSQANDISKPKMQRKTRSNKLPPSDQEMQKEGPITTILRSVESVSTYLTGIPLLSSYAGVTSWASGIAANAASAFGWSKPINVHPIARMNRTLNQFQNNCDGQDNAVNLGLCHDNHVRPMPGFGGTDIDEMSIDFLKGISVWIQNVNWPVNTLNGALLWTYDLRPYNQGHNVGGFMPNGIVCGPVQYLAGMFKQYRGGFILKFKFAKTQFHSGRLLIVFSPGFSAKTAAADGTQSDTNKSTAGNTPYLHREIIDVRMGNEFELYFPYVNFYPYLETSQSYGSVQVFVQNTLKCPATVAQNVTMAVEMRAASDFEFAKPCQPTILPTVANVYAAAQAGSLGKPQYQRKARFQVGEESRDECQLTQMKPIGGSDFNRPVNTDFAEICVGEQVRSVKQLAQRGCWLNASGGKFNTFRPFLIGALPMSPQGTRQFEPHDYYSAIASMYAFSRGGVIIRLFDQSGNWKVLQLSDDASNMLLPNVTNKRLYNNSNVVENTGANAISVYVPHYGITHGRLNAPDQSGPTSLLVKMGAQYPYYNTCVLTRYQLSFPLVDDSYTTLHMRSAADDTQFGFFLGVPPCQANPNANITT